MRFLKDKGFWASLVLSTLTAVLAAVLCGFWRESLYLACKTAVAGKYDFYLVKSRGFGNCEFINRVFYGKIRSRANFSFSFAGFNCLVRRQCDFGVAGEY